MKLTKEQFNQYKTGWKYEEVKTYQHNGLIRARKGNQTLDMIPSEHDKK